MNIGERIKYFRSLNSISTYKLSELTGISQPVLSKLENGKRSVDIDLLLKITTKLNITISELMGETEPQLTPELKTLVDNAKTLTPEQLDLLNRFIQAMKQYQPKYKQKKGKFFDGGTRI